MFRSIGLLLLLCCEAHAELLESFTREMSGGPWAYHVLAIGDLNYGLTVDSGVALVDPLVDQNAGEEFFVPRAYDARTLLLSTEIETGGDFVLFFDGAVEQVKLGPHSRVEQFGFRINWAMQTYDQPLPCRCSPVHNLASVTYNIYGSHTPEPSSALMLLIAMAHWPRFRCRLQPRR